MKIKKFLLGALLVLMAVLCVGCSASKNYDGKTKVVFELEGGTYQNCVRPIVHYYDFEDGTQNLIVEPSVLSNAEITKSGYHIEGWYQTKTQEGDEVVYSDKWDFATDKVDENGITLYAK